MDISRFKLKQIIPVLLAVITLIIFGQIVTFEFLGLDDHTYILNNEFITGDTTWEECLMERFREHNYFPIRNLLYRLQFKIWGENPHVFHFTNLLFYTFNVVLVYWFSLSIFRKIDISEEKAIIAAGLAGLFFSIHPLHVESVAWVISLKEPLSTFFYLLTLIFYLKWLDQKKITFLVIAALFSFLSIFSKSTAITLIAGLFLFDWFYKRKFSFAIFLDKIPFGLVSLFALYALGFIPYTNDAANVIFRENRFGYYPEYIQDLPHLLQNFTMMCLRVYFWVSQTIFPFAQTALYERDFTLHWYADVALILPFILLILLGLSIWVRKKYPFFLLGLFFFFITILPVLVQSEYGLAVFSPDRYMYLPIWGLLIVFVGFVITLSKKLYIPIFVIYGSFWLFQTLTYLPTWKNTDRLFTNCLDVDPYCRPALVHKSSKQLKAKEFEDAIETLDLVIKNGPGKHASSVFMNRALAYMHLDSTDIAIMNFDIALRIDSTNFDARLNKGVLFLNEERYEEARTEFAKAYLLDSTNIYLNKSLTRLYIKVENFPAAYQFADKVYQQDPSDQKNIKRLVTLLYTLHEYDECISFLSNQILLKPNRKFLYEIRRRCYLKTGDSINSIIDEQIIKKINDEFTVN